MQVSIAVVVLNWNSGYRLRRCLQAIIEQESPFDEVIVVDNGSSDESLRSAAAELRHLGVEVVRLRDNLGYGAGMNVGIDASTADYIVPLNCDCVLNKGFVAAARATLCEVGPNIGLLGGIVYRVASIDNLGPATVAALDSGRMRVAMDMRVSFRAEDDDAPVTKVTGACPIVSRSAIESLSPYGFAGFDADYFAYGEDIDLGLRLMRVGHRIVYAPALTACHERSYGTQRGVRGRSGVLRRYHLLNRYRNAFRHAPLRWLAVSLVVIASEDAAFAASRLVRGDSTAAADLASTWRTATSEARHHRRMGRQLPRTLTRRAAYDLVPRRRPLRAFRPRSLEDIGWFDR